MQTKYDIGDYLLYEPFKTIIIVDQIIITNGKEVFYQQSDSTSNYIEKKLVKIKYELDE